MGCSDRAGLPTILLTLATGFHPLTTQPWLACALPASTVSGASLSVQWVRVYHGALDYVRWRARSPPDNGAERRRQPRDESMWEDQLAGGEMQPEEPARRGRRIRLPKGGSWTVQMLDLNGDGHAKAALVALALACR